MNSKKITTNKKTHKRKTFKMRLTAFFMSLIMCISAISIGIGEKEPIIAQASGGKTWSQLESFLQGYLGYSYSDTNPSDYKGQGLSGGTGSGFSCTGFALYPVWQGYYGDNSLLRNMKKIDNYLTNTYSGSGYAMSYAPYIYEILTNHTSDGVINSAGKKQTWRDMVSTLEPTNDWELVYDDINCFRNGTTCKTADEIRTLWKAKVKEGDLIIFYNKDLSSDNISGYSLTHVGIAGKNGYIYHSAPDNVKYDEVGAYFPTVVNSTQTKRVTGMAVFRLNGSIRICKTTLGEDAKAHLTNDNLSYDGTTFGIYTSNSSFGSEVDEDGNKKLSDNVKIGEIKLNYTATDTDNVSDSVSVSAGSYYLQEISADTEGTHKLNYKIYGPFTVPYGTRITVGEADTDAVTDYVSNNTRLDNEADSFGSLKLEKRSSRPDMTDNNPCYDLGNAEYEVKDESGVVVGKFKTEVVTTDTTVAIGKVTEAKYNQANVGTDTLTDLPFGKYTITETKAPKNYLLGSPQTAIITKDHIDTPYVFKHTDMPDNDPLTLSIIKEDYESLDEKGKAKADANLEGTEFTVKYYANLDWDSIGDIPANAQPTRTWVVGVKKATDVNGDTFFRALLNNDYKVSGDEFYLDEGGQPIIPYGCITVQETKTTDAYKEWIEEATILDENRQPVNNGVYFRVINGTANPSADWVITAQNKVTRTELTFEKINYKTREKMVNIPFRLSLLDDNGNVIESHIIVTDENGKFDTELVAHSTNTNGNDNAVPDSKGNYDGLTPKGVWFYGTTEQGHSKIIDSEGALLYGHYKLEELKCSNNEGLQLIVAENFDILDSTKKNIGTISNVPEPQIETEVRDKNTNSHFSVIGNNVTVIDTINYSYLTVDTTYTLWGLLVDVNTGKPLKDVNGDIIVSEPTVFTTPKEYVESKQEICGSKDVIFTFDATGMDGKDVVIYQYLYKGDKSSGYDFLDANGDIVEGTYMLAHDSLNNTKETFYFPSIKTEAFSVETTSNTLSTDEKVNIGDMVYLDNLMVGETYELIATLVNKNTGEVLKNENGEVITSKPCVFTANSTNVTKNVFFPTIKRELIISQEADIVVFEELIWKKDTGDIKYAEHTDINDTAQTLTAVTIGTKASGMDGEKVVPANEKATIVDTVTYRNLNIGEEYELFGTLMVKSTNKPLLDKDGKEVTASKKFKPTEKDGTTDLTFTFDASLLQGESIVVFESLKYEGIEVAFHTDIEDDDQTVTVAKISTSLVEKESGLPMGYLNEELTLVDTVSYEDFIPNREYRVVGILMNKDTGLPLVKDGSLLDFVTAETTFTPTKEDGTVDVEFTFNAYEVGIVKEDGSVSDIVCFETAYYTEVNDEGVAEEKIFAYHQDLLAVSQTVQIAYGKTTAKDSKTETHTGTPEEKATVVDTVFYNNLIVGKEYTIKGKLWTKDAEGKAIPFLDNGKEVTSEVTFIPTVSSSSIDMVFTFNASSLKNSGTTITVFEDCYYEDTEILVFTHSDIEDKDQSIEYPKMWTEIKAKNGNKSLEPEHKYTLIDTITYENLVVGETYVIEGVLMEKVETRDTNGTVLSVSEKEYVNPSGNKSTAKVEFTPTEKNGKVDVSFEFYTSEDTYNKTFVCFERIYTKDTHIEVCDHTDINDAKQSFTVTDQVRTGDFPIALVVAFMLLAMVGIVAMVFFRKKNGDIPLIKM